MENISIKKLAVWTNIGMVVGTVFNWMWYRSQMCLNYYSWWEEHAKWVFLGIAPSTWIRVEPCITVALMVVCGIIINRLFYIASK